MRAAIIPVAAVFMLASAAYASDESQIAEQIRNDARQSLEAFNRHDAAALANWIAEKATFALSKSERMTGREEICKHYAQAFAGPLKNCELSNDIEHIDVIRADLALADCVSRMKLNGADDDAHGDVHLVMVYVREGDHWLIAAVRQTAEQGQ